MINVSKAKRFGYRPGMWSITPQQARKLCGQFNRPVPRPGYEVELTNLSKYMYVSRAYIENKAGTYYLRDEGHIIGVKEQA